MHDTLRARPPVIGEPGDDRIFSTLLAQLQVGVVIAARNGHIELVNDAAHKLFAEHRRMHPSPEPWVAPSDANAGRLEPIHWIIARVLLTGEIVRDEEIQYRAHDGWRTLSVNATPIEDKRRHISQALVTFIDVTAANRAREWEPVIRALSRL